MPSQSKQGDRKRVKDLPSEAENIAGLRQTFGVEHNDVLDVMLGEMQRGAAYGGAVDQSRRRHRCRFCDDQPDDPNNDEVDVLD